MTDISRLLELESIIHTTMGNTKENNQEYKSLLEKAVKAEERYKKSVFVKCKLPECFPEHKYIEKENIFYCERLDIGEVNWD